MTARSDAALLFSGAAIGGGLGAYLALRFWNGQQPGNSGSGGGKCGKKSQAATTSQPPSVTVTTNTPSSSEPVTKSFAPNDIEPKSVTSYGGDVDIEYCVGCRWMLRASWAAQELLTTFADPSKPEEGRTVRSVRLIPSQGQGGGIFRVKVNGELVWDRKIDGCFPEMKELKQRVRDRFSPLPSPPSFFLRKQYSTPKKQYSTPKTIQHSSCLLFLHSENVLIRTNRVAPEHDLGHSDKQGHFSRT
jgi:selenoprotein W-related protein